MNDANAEEYKSEDGSSISSNVCLLSSSWENDNYRVMAITLKVTA